MSEGLLERAIVIRQAISCDICGNEKRQTNHWFVAYEQAGELRVAGWNSRNRLRAGTKHLCGQTCLHKLLDEFIAKAMDQRAPSQTQSEYSTDDAAIPSSLRSIPPNRVDASLTSSAAFDDNDSSARLIPAAASASKIDAEVATLATRKTAAAVAPLIEETRFSSRSRRAEAWERERERETRGPDCRVDVTRRRAAGR